MADNQTRIKLAPSQSVVPLAVVNTSDVIQFQVGTDGSLGIAGSTSTSGKINLPDHTTAAGGLYIGSDVTLYRSAAHTLKTDDSLTVGSALNVTGAASAASFDHVGNVAVQTDMSAFDGAILSYNAASSRFELDTLPASSGGNYTVTFNATTSWTQNGSEYYIQFGHDLNTYAVQVELWDSTTGLIQTFAGKVEVVDLNNVKITVPSSTYRFAGRVVVLSGGVSGVQVYEAIGVIIDGGGSAIPVDASCQGYRVVFEAGEITEWAIYADQVGSISFTVKKSDYTGYPTDSPFMTCALTSAAKARATGLEGSGYTLNAGDVLTFYYSSPSTVTRATLMLKVKRS